MKKLIFGLTVFFICIPIYTQATEDVWSATGHRVVGKIADNYLCKKTKKEVKRLLNRQSLAFVSTFGDEIKSDQRYNKFYTWHFVNMPLDSDYKSF